MYDFIYPEEIDVKVQNAGKTSTEDKFKLFFSLLIGSDVVALFILPSILKGIGGGLGLSVIIILIANIFIFFTIGRYGVFDEKSRLKEYKSYSDDSLGRFYKIRDENVKEITLYDEEVVKLYGFDDGSFMSCLCLRFGYNGEENMDFTFQSLVNVFRSLSFSDIEFRTLVSREDFLETDEYSDYVNKLNDAEFKKLAAFQMRVLDVATRIAEKESNVSVIHLVMRFTDSQSYEAAQILYEVKRLARSSMNGFRSAQYIDFKTYVNVVRKYYGLEVVDLAMLKVAEPTEDELYDILQAIKVSKVNADNGSVYKPEDVQEIKTVARKVR